MLPKLSETTQTIAFSEGDGICSAEVFSNNVLITTNAGSHNHGSSKVKLKNLVDYSWESKLYSGQLLALHMSGKYLAYVIKASNPANPGTWNGMVRVVYNPESGNDRRALIKGMTGEVHDLSFAHIEKQVILACIDEQGTFYIHEIELTDSGLRCSLLAEVLSGGGGGGIASCGRVVWCPYIPDDEDAPDDDVARLLLTTHGVTARMWNIRQVIEELRTSSPPVSSASALEGAAGAVSSRDHSAPVVAAAFSPDGTALATAAADGQVMFFQVYMHNEATPRCLHTWRPHAGKPLSSLFFLDNHKNYNSDVQFWKFAVTGAENNTCLKIWSCKSWTCLQTITFTPGLGQEPTLGLNAQLDTSATYLLLSDFKARSLYVLTMARDEDDPVYSYCKSISEFLLPYPVLSFCIVDAGEEVVKCESSCDDPFHANGEVVDARDSPGAYSPHNELSKSGCGGRVVKLRTYIVQPRGLQQGELTFNAATDNDVSLGMSSLRLESSPPAEVSIPSSILQQQTQQLQNLLMRTQSQPGSLIVHRAESPAPAAAPAPPSLTLMTPDAFSSPGKRDEEDPPLSATPDVTAAAAAARLSQGAGTSPGGAGAAAAGAAGSGASTRSGGSSPSREVEQILHTDANHGEELSHSPLGEAALPAAAQNGDDDIFDIVPSEEANISLSNTERVWPHFTYSQFNEANQRKSSDKSSNQSANVPDLSLLQERLELKCRGLSAEDRARLDSLENKLDTLTELISQQSRQLRTLRESAPEPRALVEMTIEAHSARTAHHVEQALQQRWEHISRMCESLGARAATAAGAGAGRALEPLAKALHNELATKLAATDKLLRDNIEKLFTSKSVMEQLSTSIASALSDMVRSSFRDAMLGSVVPCVEKAHQQMFQQLNNAFTQGTKEFLSQTERISGVMAERGGAAGAATLRAALERHAALLQAAPAAPPPPRPDLLAAACRDAAREVLQKELAWFRSEVAASRAHSPATPSAASATHDRQLQLSQIQSLLSAGDVNGAFGVALSAADLSLVTACCRGVSPAAVFTPRCRLKQHVLLSLVQQLAADLNRDTQLKHRYLEEAIMNLDPNNPVTREHLPVVVREFQKQILPFLAANPDHAMKRQFKMLLMAAESLVKGAQ